MQSRWAIDQPLSLPVSPLREAGEPTVEQPSGPSLGRPRPTNVDRRHPEVTTPTPLWPGTPRMICDTGRVMPAPGELS